MLDGLVDIESRNRTCRTCSQIVGTGQYYSRTVIDFSQSGSDDSDDSFVPGFVIDDNGTPFGEVFQVVYYLVGLFGHALVQVLTGLVVAVNPVAFLQRRFEILFYQQVDRFLTVLDASRCIDTGTYLEYDVTHGDFPFRQSAYIDDGFQTYARIGVQLSQAVVCQDTVFAHNRYNVRRNADSNQVEQGSQLVKLDAVALCERLHEFETYSTTRQVVVRIRRIVPFRIQDSGGCRKYLVRNVMVTDNEVDAFLFGIRNLFYGFDAAVQYDDQFHTGLIRIIYSLLRYAIPFVVTVGNVVVDVRIELLKEFENQCDGCCSVYIIVSIYHDTFLSAHGQIQPLYGYIHVFHQERVMQLTQLRAEKAFGFGCRCNTTFP